MRRCRPFELLAVTAATALLAAPALATDRPVLEPNGAWVLDYGAESCSLVRSFGAGDTITKLQLTSYGTRLGQRILLVGAAVPRSRTPTGELHYTLTPEDIVRESVTIQGTAGDLPAVSFSVAFAPYDPGEIDRNVTGSEWQQRNAEPSAPDPAFEATINGLRVVFDNGDGTEFRLGNMAKPLEALRTCVDDLLGSWGLDAAAQKTRTRNATPVPTTVQRVQSRYPDRMARSGRSAYVPVRVMVDAEGKATSCVIQEQGIDEEFTRATCSGLMRAYRPALDAVGNPMASVFHTSVIYVIGG